MNFTPLFLAVVLILAVGQSSVSAAGPDKAKYDDRMTRCTSERCKFLARSNIYFDCMEEESDCAFEGGKDGCMKKTMDCIKKVVGSA